VFVGDLIDRGIQQRDSVRIARSMVEAGAAQIVLGNHEFNAVAYSTWSDERSDWGLDGQPFPPLPVDCSAGKGGPLVAYRWDGEPDLLDDHFVSF